MSVILDALKKAQEERKRPLYREAGREERRPNRSRRLFYATVGTVVCAMLVVLFLPRLYRMQSPRSPQVAQNQPTTTPPIVPPKVIPEVPVVKRPEFRSKEDLPKLAATMPQDMRNAEDTGKAVPEKKGTKKMRVAEMSAFPKTSPKRREADSQKSAAVTESDATGVKDIKIEGKDSTVVVKRTGNERAVTNYNNAVLAAEQGNNEEAKNLYLAVLADEPNNIEALNNLGVMAIGEGNTREAALYFRRILEQRKDYAKAFNNLGIIALRDGEKKIAEEYFRKAIEVAPSGLEPYLNLAALLRSERRLEEANSVIEAPLKRGRRGDQLYLSAGLIKDELGQYEEAARYYRLYLQVSSPKEDRRRVVERLAFLEESKSATGR